MIAKAMSDAVKLSTGKDGEFLSSTIQNISNQERAVINKLHGINPDWSIAQKVIAELDKYVLFDNLIYKRLFLPPYLSYHHVYTFLFMVFYIVSVKNENGDPCLSYVALTIDKDYNVMVNQYQ